MPDRESNGALPYVQIAVALGVRRLFSYSVPPRLARRLGLGTRVVVPFGRKLVTGYVAGFSRVAPVQAVRMRAIRTVLDREPLVPSQLVRTALWTAEHYFSPPGAVLGSLFPAGTTVTGSETIRLTPRGQDALRSGTVPMDMEPGALSLLQTLADEGPAPWKEVERRRQDPGLASSMEGLAARGWIERVEELEKPRVRARSVLGIRPLAGEDAAAGKLTAAQRRLLSRLDPAAGQRPLRETLREAGCSSSVAENLARKGLAEIKPMAVDRLPLELSDAVVRGRPELTPAQQSALDRFQGLLDAGGARRGLLHGVTGSGKTEVYLRLMAEAVRRGDSAMLLVPEIGLTPLLSRIVASEFPQRVAVLHSGMSPGERFDQWQRIRSGRATVVLGTRSAVWAPLERLRVIILDEEQDGSYKQDESPHYHAREVAWQRLQNSGGVLLLGTATPSIETYHAAARGADVAYAYLADRIRARPLPEVEIVDMSLEFQRHGKSAVVSAALQDELGARLDRREQAIVLLNRRGYSRALLCRSCGVSVSCPDCSVAMTYHRHDARLICHYCGAMKAPPERCPQCSGSYIYFLGVGTEQLEEILRGRFPTARIARVDRDTTRRRGALKKILVDFSERRLDVLVGTQILAKGHDFPDVTLVGVVAADAGLSFPDFRAAERTFQLLTQVAGRAGRGHIPGRVVIQAYYPDHYALAFARRQDYFGFYAREIEFRRLLGYPPFCDLVQIIVSGPADKKARTTADRLAAELRTICREQGSGARTLGPAPAPLEKIRGAYRFQILIKSAPGTDRTGILREAFQRMAKRKLALKSVQVDVDPLSLM